MPDPRQALAHGGQLRQHHDRLAIGARLAGDRIGHLLAILRHQHQYQSEDHQPEQAQQHLVGTFRQPEVKRRLQTKEPVDGDDRQSLHPLVRVMGGLVGQLPQAGRRRVRGEKERRGGEYQPRQQRGVDQDHRDIARFLLRIDQRQHAVGCRREDQDGQQIEQQVAAQMQQPGEQRPLFVVVGGDAAATQQAAHQPGGNETGAQGGTQPPEHQYPAPAHLFVLQRGHGAGRQLRQALQRVDQRARCMGHRGHAFGQRLDRLRGRGLDGVFLGRGLLRLGQGTQLANQLFALCRVFERGGQRLDLFAVQRLRLCVCRRFGHRRGRPYVHGRKHRDEEEGKEDGAQNGHRSRTPGGLVAWPNTSGRFAIHTGEFKGCGVWAIPPGRSPPPDNIVPGTGCGVTDHWIKAVRIPG